MRPIDADALLEKLQRMIDYCKNDNQVNGLTALFQVGDAIMDCPTLTPPNEPLTGGGWGRTMKGVISYEKALGILDKIDDSYFSEEVVGNDKLLNEVWEMLALAERLFRIHLDICGPEGDPGATETGQTDGEFDRALDENQGVKGGFVMGRFFPLEWIQQYEKKDKPTEPPNV